MDAAIDFLAGAVLVALPVNLVDWLLVRRGPLMWAPRSYGRYLWFAWYAVTAVVAFSFQRRWIPSSVLGWVVLPPFILEQLLSIWMRHARRATPGS